MMGFGFVPSTPTFMMEKWRRCKTTKYVIKKACFTTKNVIIPFYDPILIIEKAGSRMADDPFWIKIER